MRESERESERENIFFLQAKFIGRERESEGICNPPGFYVFFNERGRGKIPLGQFQSLMSSTFQPIASRQSITSSDNEKAPS